MNEKGKILQELMARNFFAASPTRVAAELGISGKMVFTRLAQGTAGEKATDRLWEQILYSYNLTDARLRMLPEILHLSEYLAANYRAEQLPELLQPDEKVIPEAESINRYDPLAYCYAMALYYTKAQHMTPNASGDSEVLIEILQQVNALLLRHFPDAHQARAVTADSLTQARKMPIGGWCHLMNIVGRVICYYAHPLYMGDESVEQFQPVPWEGKQWWVADEGDRRYKLWLMDQPQEGVAIYNVLQIPVYLLGAPDMDEVVFQRWVFMEKYGIVRIVLPEGTKLVRHGYYDYQMTDSELSEMTLQERADLPSSAPWQLPKTMRQVTIYSIWDEWINQYGKEIEERLAAETIKAMGQEETDYEVKNVTMSRNQCVLTVSGPDEPLRTIVLSIDKHPILCNVSVWDEVIITRGIADGKLYACWENNIIVDL